MRRVAQGNVMRMQKLVAGDPLQYDPWPYRAGRA